MHKSYPIRQTKKQIQLIWVIFTGEERLEYLLIEVTYTIEFQWHLWLFPLKEFQAFTFMRLQFYYILSCKTAWASVRQRRISFQDQPQILVCLEVLGFELAIL